MNDKLVLYNSLTSSLQFFNKNIKDEVLMYNCGPTVYDVQHIGNLSAFIFADTIRKVLEFNGYKVKQVINITDIGHLSGDNNGDPNVGDDKMMKGLMSNNLPISLEGLKVLSEKYTSIFLDDLKKMGIPVADIFFPRASEYITEQIEMVKVLEKKGHTYSLEDGVYFNTSTFLNYGVLGGVSKILFDKNYIRVSENSNKRNPQDFVLWKYNSSYGWESPWGKGFPGWHIECSAMASAILGPKIDIHTGGIEHINIHHNNEIAQSECANGCGPFSKFWIHRNHIQINGGKLSKSQGSVIFLSDVIKKNFSPYDLRYFFLQAHYSTASNFTWEALKSSSVARKRLINFVSNYLNDGVIINKYLDLFLEACNNNLNTPKALAVMWIMMEDVNFSVKDKVATILTFDKVFCLNLSDDKDHNVKIFTKFPAEDLLYMEKRKIARKEKQWVTSDKIRDILKNLGYSIIDSESLTTYEMSGTKMTF